MITTMQINTASTYSAISMQHPSLTTSRAYQYTDENFEHSNRLAAQWVTKGENEDHIKGCYEHAMPELELREKEA